MGLDTPAYRVRKQRLREILTRKPGRYIEHLAHAGIAAAEGDQRFRKELFDFAACGRGGFHGPAHAAAGVA